MNFIHTHFFSPSPLTHIDRVCDDYQRQVQDKAWQLQNDIREWRENTVKQINQHTDVQIRLLETWKYNTLRRIQEEKSVYSDWIIVYSEKKDDNEVKNIIRLYESLKYKLEELTYDMKPSVFFPYAPSSEQQQQQQQQSQATKQTDQLYNSTHKTGQQLSTRTSNDISNSRQSLTPSTTTTTTDETSNTKSRFNQESDFINQKQRTGRMTDETYSSSTAKFLNGRNNIGGETKCPVCMMIFDSRMPPEEKEKHIIEHCD